MVAPETRVMVKVPSYGDVMSEVRAEVLNIQSIKDLQHYAAEDVWKRVGERQASDIAKGIKGRCISEYLTLGECSGMIQRGGNWDLFKPIFVESGSGFVSQQGLNTSMQLVIEYRNAIKHGRAPFYKYGDKERITIYVKKLQRCIDEHASGKPVGENEG